MKSGSSSRKGGGQQLQGIFFIILLLDLELTGVLLITQFITKQEMELQKSWTFVPMLFFIGVFGLTFASPGDTSKLGESQKELRDFGFPSGPIFDGNTEAADWLDQMKKDMQTAFEKIKSVNDEIQQRINPARESVKAKVSAAGHRVVESIRQGTEHGTSTSTATFSTMSSDGKGPAVGSKNVVTKTTSFEQHFP